MDRFDPVQTASLTLLASSASALDSGIVVQSGEALRVQVAGEINWGGTGSTVAYPEGAYAASGVTSGSYPPAGGFMAVPYYTPTAVYFPAPGTVANLVAHNLPPFCTAVLLVPDGSGSPAVDGTFTGIQLQPNRGTVWAPYQLPQSGGPYRVWIILNDAYLAFGDNTGSQQVTVERGRLSPQTEVEPRFYDPTTGERIPFNWAEVVSCDWELLDAGGMGQANTDLAHTFDDASFAPLGGSISKIW